MPYAISVYTVEELEQLVNETFNVPNGYQSIDPQVTVPLIVDIAYADTMDMAYAVNQMKDFKNGDASYCHPFDMAVSGMIPGLPGKFLVI